MMPTPRQFKMIAAAALAGFDAVMDWLGLSGGKNAGREYQPLNPKRDDHTPGSLSIHRDKGTWADFATGDKGGDLISLAAYLWDCRNGEAAERLGKHLGILQDGRESAGKGADGSVPPVSEKPANAPGKPRDGVCVLPVPADAPPVPVAHPTHGKAAARWDYVDARGATMFYHCRFEPVDKRKQFASLTLWRLPDGGLAWKWKVPPDPRPLLGLDRLTACPQAVVVIVEGEKAGDAAALLLPDAVVMTWQGGANAVDKADWTPLSGRRVWLWPDADLPGRKAMRRAAMRLRAVGAADVRWIDLNALAKTASVREGRAELIAGAPLAEGDDAADLAMRGWTAAHLAGLIESGSLLTEVDGEIPDEAAGEKAAPLSRKRGFRLDDQGVWFVDVNRDGEECTPRWISAPLDILARVRDPQNCGWGLWVGFDDPDGRPHKEIIPARSFNGEGLEATGLLLDRGLTIAPRGRPLLLEYLQTANPKQRARVTARTGWHEADERRVFVLPEIAFGQGEQAWIFESESPAGNFRQKGTLAEWKEGVACLCTGNSRLAFAVSMTFAAPLLYLAGEESGGFHLCGAASNGKTSALRVAASVCGGPDYMQRWRSTDNGLEVLAVQHCDSLLLLDELAQIDPKVAGESAYLLANGSGKARAGRNGGLRARLDWRLLFLSTGEIGLATHMMEVGKQTRAGQELRLAEIPADAGAGCGLFEALHDSKDGAAFAQTLDQATRRAYGSAWTAFLKRLVLEDAGEIARELRTAQKRFGGRYLSEQAGGQAQRLANRFALVGAAGELATSWGLTDWPAGEAMQAAGVCFAAWLANRGGEGNQEERAMLGKVREFLRRYGESAFTDTGRSNITDDHAPVRSDRAGWRECSDNETHYFISNEAFHARVCTGFDFRAVGRLLLARGFAEAGTEKDRPWLTRKAIPGEGRARVVHVLPAIFEDANEKND
jgi:uncharacterized protein (DUF927 family)